MPPFFKFNDLEQEVNKKSIDFGGEDMVTGKERLGAYKEKALNNSQILS